jgi:hypothetical protein
MCCKKDINKNIWLRQKMNKKAKVLKDSKKGRKIEGRADREIKLQEVTVRERGNKCEWSKLQLCKQTYMFCLVCFWFKVNCSAQKFMRNNKKLLRLRNVVKLNNPIIYFPSQDFLITRFHRHYLDNWKKLRKLIFIFKLSRSSLECYVLITDF